MPGDVTPRESGLTEPPATATSGGSRFGPALLREHNFRNFWFGQTISVFGDQITLLALPIVAVLILDADPAQMGLLTAVGLLPHLLLSLPAGVWLDRIQRRRRLMVVGDVIRAAVIAMVPLAFVLDVLSIELLFVVTFVVGTVAVFFDLAWLTMLSTVARRDQLVDANSLLNTSRSVSAVGGPAIGGVMIHFLTAPIALVADAISYLASALFLRRVRVADSPVEHEPGTVREQLTAGMSFLVRDPIMRPAVFAVATMNLFNYGFQALFILFATRHLHLDPGVLGLALGVGAVGGIVGAVVAGPLGRRIGIGPGYIVGLVLFPAAAIVIPLAEGLPFAAIVGVLIVAEFFGGLGVMILDINGGSLLLARMPARIRGRAGGAFRFINMGIRPIGATMGGILGSLIGVRETLLIVTVAQLLGLLWLIGSPIPGLKEIPEPPE
jgi:MFS family permease